MVRTTTLAYMLGLLFLLGFTGAPSAAQTPDPKGQVMQTPLGTGFTYQGRLTDAQGRPVEGPCNFRFKVYDVETGGDPITPMLSQNAVLDKGLFTIPNLDFGPGIFDGNQRWLWINFRCPADTGEWTELKDRLLITAVPYAMFAAAGGSITAVDSGPGLLGGGSSGQLTLSADTAYLQRRIGGVCSTGNAIRAINEDGSVVCEPVGGGALSAAVKGSGMQPKDAQIAALQKQIEALESRMAVLEEAAQDTRPLPGAEGTGEGGRGDSGGLAALAVGGLAVAGMIAGRQSARGRQ